MPLVTGVQASSVPALSFVESLSRIAEAKPASVQATASLSTLARALIASGTIDAILKVTEVGSTDAAPSRVLGHERFDLEDPVVPVTVAGEPERGAAPSPASGLQAAPVEADPIAPGKSLLTDDAGSGERSTPQDSSSQQGVRLGKETATIATQTQTTAGSSKAMMPDGAVATVAKVGPAARQASSLPVDVDGHAGPEAPIGAVASALPGQRQAPPGLAKALIADAAIAGLATDEAGRGKAEAELIADKHGDPDKMVETAAFALTVLQMPAKASGQFPAGPARATIADGAVATIVKAAIGQGEAEALQTVAAAPDGPEEPAADGRFGLQKPASTVIQGQAPPNLAKAMMPEAAIAPIVKAELGKNETVAAQATIEAHGASGELSASATAVSPEAAGSESLPMDGASHSPSGPLDQTTSASATEQLSAAGAAGASRTHDAGAPAAQALGQQGTMTNEALARDHAEFPFPLSRRPARATPARKAPPVETCFRCKKPRRNSRCACNTGFRFLPF